jgi:hypothetical protein
VWEIGTAGVLALPTAIDRVVVHKLGAHEGGTVYAEIEPRDCSDDEICFDARVGDEQGNLCLELEGYRTARLPSPVDEAHVAPLREVVKGETA